MPTFDADGARKAGYSESEIADYLGKQAGFDVEAARKAEYKDADIIAHITAAPARPKRVPVDVEAAGRDAAVKAAKETGSGDVIAAGIGRTIDRVNKGVQQAYYAVTGNDKAQAALKEQAAHQDKMWAPVQEARPVLSGLGEAAPSMAIPVGGAATALGAGARMAGAGAVIPALEYGSAGERTSNAAAGAAGATLGGVVAPSIVRAGVGATKSGLKGLAGNITPEAIALAGKAKQLGIPVNAAQLGDSKFLKTLASSIEQMPFTGGAKATASQRTALTNAVSKTFGDDVQKITPEVYAANKARLGTQFDDLASRNSVNVDSAFTSKLNQIQADANQMADDGTIRAVNSAIARIQNQSTSVPGIGGGTLKILPGETYSSIDSMLGNVVKNGGEKGAYAKQVQTALREAMDASISQADSQAWKQTKSEYRNLKAVRDIVARDGGNGDIPPTMLMSALNSSQAGKEGMAMGVRGTLGDIGQIGRQFVRDQTPNSGTAQRLMAMGLIGGGGTMAGVDPGTLAGMMVGGATAGRLINKIMMSPKVIEALGKRGVAVTDLAKLPPNEITRILGGAIGITATEELRKE